MPGRRPSQWPILLDIAVDIFENFRKTQGFAPIWTFGGGTALMLQIDHRESHDIDLFLDDPQLLPFLNPGTQRYALARQPDHYSAEGTHVLKLVFEDMGEIDFICCASIQDTSTERREVRGHMVDLETPAEIIAKKVWYRGTHFQPRDMFDLAAVAERYGSDYAASALRECGPDRCANALAVVEKMDPVFARTIIGQLMHSDKTDHLIADAQEICCDILKRAVSEESPVKTNVWKD